MLDDLANHMADSHFSVLLADRESRIIARRFGISAVGTALDKVLAIPGSTYAEDVAGTNALSTVFEIGHGITVVGEEHYLESLQAFCCYGHPITHPITGRLEGVLDVTGLAQESSGLMTPLVVRAVRDIEDRLHAGSRTAHQRMLAALHARTARTRAPVMAISDDITLANDAADVQIDFDLRKALRRSWMDSQFRDRAIVTIERDHGSPVHITCTPIDGAGEAVLCELVIESEHGSRVPRGSNARTDLKSTLLGYRVRRTPVLISGESGTGRSTIAAELAGDANTVFLDSSSLDESMLAAHLTSGDGLGQRLVVLENIADLEDRTADRVSRLLGQKPLWFAMTATAPAALTPSQQALAAWCTGRVNLLPLRERRGEISGLARAALSRLDLDKTLSAEATAAMERHAWPGNLRELAAVLIEAASRAGREVIELNDLPEHVRRTNRRRLGLLEQAEHDTIVACLERHQGNKVHAAAELSIGRTTLYRRMRALGIAH